MGIGVDDMFVIIQCLYNLEEKCKFKWFQDYLNKSKGKKYFFIKNVVRENNYRNNCMHLIESFNIAICVLQYILKGFQHILIKIAWKE